MGQKLTSPENDFFLANTHRVHCALFLFCPRPVRVSRPFKSLRPLSIQCSNIDLLEHPARCRLCLWPSLHSAHYPLFSCVVFATSWRYDHRTMGAIIVRLLCYLGILLSLVGHGLQQNAPYDDYSWIRRMGIVGDSYTAGIGAGVAERSSGVCARYSGSWATRMTHLFTRLSANNIFNYACSGAKTPEISEQVSRLPGNLDLVVLTAGGNDLCLVCFSFLLLFSPSFPCDHEQSPSRPQTNPRFHRRALSSRRVSCRPLPRRRAARRSSDWPNMGWTHTWRRTCAPFWSKSSPRCGGRA